MAYPGPEQVKLRPRRLTSWLRTLSVRLRTRRAMSAIAVSALLAGCLAAEAGTRVALVMVAEDYAKFQRSEIGAGRAKAIADALSARGFDVLTSINPSNSKARASLRDFAAKAAGADVALTVLLGHTVATGGQSFFLPVNAEIAVPTDLFSRGIAVSSVALMAAKARAGGVLVLMTTPTLATPVEGLDMRPEFTSETTPNVVAAFSSSAKVPVSQVDGVSQAAADALAQSLAAPAPSMEAAVAAVTRGGGVSFGTTTPASFRAPSVPEAIPAEPPPPDEGSSAALQSRLDQERQAREEAEHRAKDDQTRAAAAVLQAQRAQAELALAQEAARRAQQAADEAEAETERARAEARQAQKQAKSRQEAADAAAVETERARAEAQQAQKDAKLRQDQATANEARIASEMKATRAEAEAAKAARAKAEAERAEADKLAEERAQAAAAARAQAEQAKAEQVKLEAAAQASQAAAKPAVVPVPAASEDLPASGPASSGPAAPVEPKSVASAVPDAPGDDALGATDDDAVARERRQRIQTRLRELGFYTGTIDAKMGRATREAIMAFQKRLGEGETGYLTPEQFVALVPPPG